MHATTWPWAGLGKQHTKRSRTCRCLQRLARYLQVALVGATAETTGVPCECLSLPLTQALPSLLLSLNRCSARCYLLHPGLVLSSAAPQTPVS